MLGTQTSGSGLIGLWVVCCLTPFNCFTEAGRRQVKRVVIRGEAKGKLQGSCRLPCFATLGRRVQIAHDNSLGIPIGPIAMPKPLKREIRKRAFRLPRLAVGDILLVGKYKNRKVTITGFSSDENNQPVAQTDKGEHKIFKPRIAKLMSAK